MSFASASVRNQISLIQKGGAAEPGETVKYHPVKFSRTELERRWNERAKTENVKGGGGLADFNKHSDPEFHTKRNELQERAIRHHRGVDSMDGGSTDVESDSSYTVDDSGDSSRNHSPFSNSDDDSNYFFDDSLNQDELPISDVVVEDERTEQLHAQAESHLIAPSLAREDGINYYDEGHEYVGSMLPTWGSLYSAIANDIYEKTSPYHSWIWG